MSELAPEPYCRAVEAYLCQKNDGHLIRIVGPSFDLVSAWAARGVPFKVTCRGIDRYFERYYAKGPRRRPVRIDYCEADVLDAFDEWRRATGLSGDDEARPLPRASLREHLTRVVLRLTSARATGRVGADLDGTIDRIARELDVARSEAGGVRGAARAALLARLEAYDRELLDAARRTLDDPGRAVLRREAEDELSPFRTRMSAEAFARACEAALDRLVRERCGLPTIAFS